MTNSQNDKSKKKMTKDDWIGMVVGFFIANIIFQMGSFGFIPAFIIAFGSYWVVKKIAQLLIKEDKEKSEEHNQEFISNSKPHNTQNEVKNIEHKKSKKGPVWAGVIIIAIIFIVAVFSNQTNEQNVELVKIDKSVSYSEQDGNLYRNTKYNFRIKFPEGWNIEAGDGPNILQKAVKGNHTVSIGVREIPAEFGDKTATIKDVMSITEFKDTLLEDVQEKFPGAKIIDYGESELDNEPAYWIKYSAPYTALDITVEGIMVQYQLLYNNNFYFITAGSTSDEYQSVEAEIMKSISTFVIENY